MTSQLRVVTVCLLGSLVLGLPAAAQTRGNTGRHQVEKPKVVVTEQEAEQARNQENNLWSFNLGFGGMVGSRLFQVESLTDGPIIWDPPAGPPFNATRLETNLERSLNLDFSVGRDFGTWFTARGSVSYTRMDMSAEALMGEGGHILLFARPNVYMMGLGGRARLVRAPSHPFLSLELMSVTLADVGGGHSLDQTNLGYRIGGGYMQVLSPTIKLRLEARFTRSAFDIGSYRPDTPRHDPELHVIEGESHLSFFEVLIGVEFRP